MNRSLLNLTTSLFFLLSTSVIAKDWQVYSEDTFLEAFQKAQDEDVINIAKGNYQASAVLKANHVTVMAEPGAVVAGSAAKGKAALVISGDGTKIFNLECHSISVSDGNGACIRLEAASLFLKNVYFHDSQQGLLSSPKSELIEIVGSKFERLGFGGRAHGIYVTGGKTRLLIKDSSFISSVGEGHEIKSRGSYVLIEQCLIASLDEEDSRLIDMSNGGELIIRNSVLQEGFHSSNSDLIGVGLEGVKHEVNKVTLENNVILVDRRPAYLLHYRNKDIEVSAKQNIIVGLKNVNLPGINLVFESRKELGMEEYPYIPPVPGK